jgi:hypothetical protein
MSFFVPKSQNFLQKCIFFPKIFAGGDTLGTPPPKKKLMYESYLSFPNKTKPNMTSPHPNQPIPDVLKFNTDINEMVPPPHS